MQEEVAAERARYAHEVAELEGRAARATATTGPTTTSRDAAL